MNQNCGCEESANNPLGLNCDEPVSLVSETNDNTPTYYVLSVNGKDGIVVLSTSDIGEGLNKYFTDARARNAINAAAPLSFDQASGQFVHGISGVTAATYGSATEYPVITVNDKGHITNVTVKSVTSLGLPASISGIADLTTLGYLVRTAENTWVLRSLAGTAGRVAISNPAGTAGVSAVDLVATAVTAGTYGTTLKVPRFTVDAYGRITGVTEVDIAFPAGGSGPSTIGDLTNVAAAADAPGTIGSVLVWDGAQWTVGAPTATTFTQKTTISSAELLNGFTVPKILLTAQGAGKILQPTSLVIKFNFNSTAYTTNFTARLRYSSCVAPMATFSINYAQSTYEKVPLISAIFADPEDISNKDLILDIATGNPAAGDGSMNVYITYTVISI